MDSIIVFLPVKKAQVPEYEKSLKLQSTLAAVESSVESVVTIK